MELRDNCLPFWREITLRASQGRVDAEVVDNVHHFVITVRHDGDVVTAVTGVPVRVPWVTCPNAVDELMVLRGTSVAAGSRARIEQARQCTHMLDLARLAIAQVSRGGTRRYRAAINFDADANMIVAQLERDRRCVLDWRVRRGIVVSPAPFAGHDTQGRSSWSEAVAADADLVEAGLVLRRAVYIFRSRRFSAPRRSAADTPGMTGVCYSFQPERAHLAIRPDDFVELP